jgi:hypothetical protein
MNSREFGLFQSTEDRACLQAKLMRRKCIWQIRQSDSALEELTSFVLSENTGDAILGTQGGLVTTMATWTGPSTMIEPQTPITRFTSQVTSISLSTTDHFVCCSFGNDHSSGTIHFGHFTPDDERHFGLDVNYVMSLREKQALFCSTISRYTSGLIAVGAEKVIFVANEFGDQRPLLPIKSSCLALEFLGANTLAAGMRNGHIR